MQHRMPYEFTTDKAWDDTPEVSENAVSDVLVVGDIHGDEQHLTNAIDQAVDFGCDVVVQVGDFWLGDRHWSRFNHVESAYMHAAHDSPLPIVVIDGNHEIWPSLGRYALGAEARAAFKSRRPLHLGGSIWWAWRGSVWRWGARRFGALGGAVSPDRRDRTLRHWRWDDEGTTEDDLERFIANADLEFGGRLDVLFTHDAPAQVQNLKSGMTGIPWDIQHAANVGRRLLAEAVDHTQPTYVLHGHWHQANHEHINDHTEVLGLAEDGRSNSTALISTQPTLVASHA